jgi:hypothetical protein
MVESALLQSLLNMVFTTVNWKMTVEATEVEKSIILTIQDNDINRRSVGHDNGENPFLAQGAFNRIDVTNSLTNYPVTDLIFTYKIPLKKNEEFVRLSMKVDNPTNK